MAMSNSTCLELLGKPNRKLDSRASVGLITVDSTGSDAAGLTVGGSVAEEGVDAGLVLGGVPAEDAALSVA